MFTTKGWLVLPLSLALRIPFAVLAYVFLTLADFFRSLGRSADRTMNKMIAPAYNPAWIEEQRQAAIKKFTNRYKD
jgi:hypothetical protein